MVINSPHLWNEHQNCQDICPSQLDPHIQHNASQISNKEWKYSQGIEFKSNNKAGVKCTKAGVKCPELIY